MSTILGHALVVLDPSACTTVWCCECGRVGLVIEGDDAGRVAALTEHWVHAHEYVQRDRGSKSPDFVARPSRINHDRDARITELCDAGHTWKQIAAEVGMSQSGLSQAAKRLGLRGRRSAA